jgi:tetratricopeptide (TPR) repeat protein
MPELRMGYARALLDAQRYPEALQQLKLITTERPEFAEAWLVQGLAAGAGQPAAARPKRRSSATSNWRRSRAAKSASAASRRPTCAVADRREAPDFAGASAWLDRIDDPQDLMAAQNRRASILARQGKMDEARKLLRAFPSATPATPASR